VVEKPPPESPAWVNAGQPQPAFSTFRSPDVPPKAGQGGSGAHFSSSDGKVVGSNSRCERSVHSVRNLDSLVVRTPACEPPHELLAPAAKPHLTTSMVRGSASTRPGRHNIGFSGVCSDFRRYGGPRRVVVCGRFPPSFATACSMSAVWNAPAGSDARQRSSGVAAAATAVPMNATGRC
jgi:hypothetical protein